MLNITSTMADILKQKTNALDVKIFYGNSTVSYDDITDLSITDSLTTKGTWIFGDAPSRTLSLSLRGITKTGFNAYDETTMTTTQEGRVFTVDNILGDDDEDWESEEGIDVEIDDSVFEDGTTIEENYQADFQQMNYPLDWTLYPIVVKLGINNKPIDNVNDTQIVNNLKSQLQEGEQFITYSAGDDEEEDDAIEVSMEEFIADMSSEENQQAQEQSTDIDYNYITLGTFYVCNSNDVVVSNTTGAITLVAYDAIYKKKDMIYTSALSFPAPLSSVVQEMETKFGITWSGVIPIISVPQKAVQGLAFRKVLQNLALLTGSNIAVEPEGNFEFLYPTEVNYSLTGADYHGINLTADTENITRIECICEGDDTYNVFRHGTTVGKTFSFTNNFITTQQQVDEIYSMAGMPTFFQPYALVAPIYPQLELGDIITVRDSNNVDRKLLVADIEISISPKGICETFSCAVPTNQALGQQGGFSQYIHSLRADLISANTIIAEKLDATLANIDTANISTAAINYLSGQIIDANQISAICANLGYLTSTQIAADYASLNLLNSSYATVGQLQSSFVSANVLTSSYASLDYLHNNYADITQLNSSYANVNLANITQGALSRLFVDTGIITDATVSTASITGMLNSVNVNADKITAGTLNVNRLNIYDDTSGIIYAINAQNVAAAALGQLTTYAQTHQFHGNDIVANSITANQIAGNTITGDKIAGNTITAGKLDVNTLSAISADMGTLTAGIIQGDNAYFNLSGGDIRLGSTTGTWQRITEKSITSKFKDISFFNIENKKINSTYQIESVYMMTEGDTWKNMGSNYLFFQFDTGEMWYGDGSMYFSNPSLVFPASFDAVYTYDLIIDNCQVLYDTELDSMLYNFTIQLSNVKKNGVAVNPNTAAWNTMISDLSAEGNEFDIFTDIYWLGIDYNLGNIVYSNLEDTNYNLGCSNYLDGNFASAFGVYNKIVGEKSIGIGHANDIENNNCLALGLNNYVSGLEGIVLGNASTATNDGSIAIGRNIQSSSTVSIGIGLEVEASGQQAFSVGNNTTARGDNSVAIGYNSYSLGTRNISLGYMTRSSIGTSIVSIGDSIITTGNYAVSIGSLLNNSGAGAVVLGKSNRCDGGNYSSIFGYNNQSSYSFTTVFGRDNETGRDEQTVLGRYNAIDSTAIFVLGNGSINARKNVLAIDETGNAEFGGVVRDAGSDITSASSILTVASGITIRNIEFVRVGRLCQFQIIFNKNSTVSCAANGNIPDITVGTLKDAFKPRLATPFSGGGNELGTNGMIGTDGVITCRTVAARTSATTFAKNTSSFTVRGSYMLKNWWEK